MLTLFLHMNKLGCNNTQLKMHARTHISTKLRVIYSRPLFIMLLLFSEHIYPSISYFI